MNKEETKQAILGFAEFFKGITGNQNLKIPDDIAKEYGIETTLKIEPCEDCISRQAAIEVVRKWFDRIQLNGDICLDGIISLPSVIPQSKIGHWILQPSNKEQGERDFIWWKCSKCGQVIYSETEKDRQEYHAFCGRCGAKMENETRLY